MDSGGPKRYSLGGRSLYTDPFAEIQGSSPLTHVSSQPRLSTSAFSLFPSPSDLSGFPIEEGSNLSEKAEFAEETTVMQETYSHYEGDHGTQVAKVVAYSQKTVQRHVGEANTGRDSLDVICRPSVDNESTEKFLEKEDAPLVPRSSDDKTPDLLGGPKSVGRSSIAYSSIREVATPRTSPPDSELNRLCRTEISGIEQQEDPTGFSSINRTNSLGGPWFEEKADISILGHPSDLGPVSFPSHGRTSSSSLDVLRTGDTLAVRSFISESLATVDDFKDRALFCQVVEAASFTNPSLRDSADEAVSVLLSCIDSEDQTTTASALGAIWNLSSDVSADKGQLVQSARQAMTLFPLDSAVQKNALGVLVSLMTDRELEPQIAACIDCVLAAVRTHKTEQSIIEHACQLMAMIRHKSLIPTSYYKFVADTACEHADPAVRRWGTLLRKAAPKH